jgi:hypothetical protein
MIESIADTKQDDAVLKTFVPELRTLFPLSDVRRIELYDKEI